MEEGRGEKRGDWGKGEEREEEGQQEREGVASTYKQKTVLLSHSTLMN